MKGVPETGQTKVRLLLVAVMEVVSNCVATEGLWEIFSEFVQITLLLAESKVQLLTTLRACKKLWSETDKDDGVLKTFE